jgi:D-threo-aldose 1-dehydrogenase
MEGGYRAMHVSRASSQVRAIGFGANEWQICEQALTHGDFDGRELYLARAAALRQTRCFSGVRGAV